MRNVTDLIEAYKALQGKELQRRIGRRLKIKHGQNSYNIRRLERDRHLIDKGDNEELVSSVNYYLDQLKTECQQIESLQIPECVRYYPIKQIFDIIAEKRKEENKKNGLPKEFD